MRLWMLLGLSMLPLLVGCDWQLLVMASQPVISLELAQEFDIVGEWRAEPDRSSPHRRPEPVTIRPAHDDGSYGVSVKSIDEQNVRLKMTALANTDSIALMEIEIPIAADSMRILALIKVDGDDLYLGYLDGASLMKVLREEQVAVTSESRGLFNVVDCDTSQLLAVISTRWRDLVKDSCVLHRVKTK